jgi:hypothetical protein
MTESDDWCWCVLGVGVCRVLVCVGVLLCVGGCWRASGVCVCVCVCVGVCCVCNVVVVGWFLGFVGVCLCALRVLVGVTTGVLSMLASVGCVTTTPPHHHHTCVRC